MVTIYKEHQKKVMTILEIKAGDTLNDNDQLRGATCCRTASCKCL